MTGGKPRASLSLDLDNKWSYLKTHGDAGWDKLPTYLPTVVPRVLKLLADHKLTITWFIVGQDAALDHHADTLRSITAAGHEVGNHSFHHEPWLHLYSREQIHDELSRTEDAIEKATGVRPTGFRGPGYSASEAVLEVLLERGYRFDASTFPTYLGPLARAYYFMTAKLSPEEKKKRAKLFGTIADGHRPLKPYRWETARGRLLEIPVTTLPLAKVPIHLSYLLYLGRFSRFAARNYFRTAMAFCRWAHVEPSILLHPLDFLGADDDGDLSFFPAMDRPANWKLELAAEVFDGLARHFQVLPMGRYAATLEGVKLPVRQPDFVRKS
ncbi:polysaccharide deacetylase family protein [Limnoglobus roseus]|uniref:Putative beta/alpha-barrel-type carbohydrate esterase n=1 Tax=Limnoglobus roseus TaxID=2598579 RepID=A0A5C1ADV0_9BACT|nr:polysaccharide deacetylase family protein [Limnoglobus roseus]QEL15294.1 putative beta/alpha-barrel-type carbohydrate esterase [Limnoglobus roseus]